MVPMDMFTRSLIATEPDREASTALLGSSLLVELAPATYTAGRYLPQLFGAHLVRGHSSRRPLLLAIVIAGGVGILTIVCTAQMIRMIETAIVIVKFFIAFCLYALTTGRIGPAYGDSIAKALMKGRRVWYDGWVDPPTSGCRPRQLNCQSGVVRAQHDERGVRRLAPRVYNHLYCALRG